MALLHLHLNTRSEILRRSHKLFTYFSPKLVQLLGLSKILSVMIHLVTRLINIRIRVLNNINLRKQFLTGVGFEPGSLALRGSALLREPPKRRTRDLGSNPGARELVLFLD